MQSRTGYEKIKQSPIAAMQKRKSAHFMAEVSQQFVLATETWKNYGKQQRLQIAEKFPIPTNSFYILWIISIVRGFFYGIFYSGTHPLFIRLIYTHKEINLYHSNGNSTAIFLCFIFLWLRNIQLQEPIFIVNLTTLPLCKKKQFLPITTDIFLL